MAAPRCADLAPLVASGALVEPLVHPKPGAVTRMRAHQDKDVITFAVHSAAINAATMSACLAAEAGSEDPVADGLEAYMRALRVLGITTNVGLGQAVLLVPLAAAIIKANSVDELAERATGLALTAGPRATRAYYELLRALSPRHMGRYRGPAPDAAKVDGSLPPLAEVLRASSWDLVHSELLNSYSTSREVSRWIEELEPRLGLEGAASFALLRLLAWRGDTLIARTYGLRAYMRARGEALGALGKEGPLRAAEELDAAWRGRGWSPGSALDILAAAISLGRLRRTVFIKGKY